MSERTEICATCRFWHPPANWKRLSEDGEGWTEGECRRRSPSVLILAIETNIPVKQTDWPQTFDDNWCGEWQALTSPKPPL